MDSEVLSSNLKALERKIVMLLNERKSLKEEVNRLMSENKDLRETLSLKGQQLDNFKNKIKITKIADRIDPEDGNISELKNKVEEYIKEIDKCIAHLST